MKVLSTFEQRLSLLETNMLPLHKLTGRLTTSQTNIEDSLVEIKKINAIFRVVKEVIRASAIGGSRAVSDMFNV